MTILWLAKSIKTINWHDPTRSDRDGNTNIENPQFFIFLVGKTYFFKIFDQFFLNCHNLDIVYMKYIETWFQIEFVFVQKNRISA